MKTFINLIFALVISTITFAQEKPVKIVFDVTSSNASVHKSAIRHVKAMSEAYPDSKFEIVVYRVAKEMLLKDKSEVAEDLSILTTHNNIDFVMCEGTMKRHKIDASDLMDGVRSVPDGILEIVQKQSEGWGYIKEGQ
jgi:intracellular sulfur oxidation DsrE/DsrF family protein